MRTGRNFLTGVLSSAWSALLGFAFVPVYIRLLGIESYGLIGFLATTQAVLQFLDLGLAATVNREVARSRALADKPDVAPLLVTLGWVYWSTAAAIAAIGIAVAPWVASRWLTSSGLDDEILARSVAWMGIVVACRWPIGLYQGALMGAERLALVSAASMISVAASHGGGALLLYFVSPSIALFFAWQAAVGLGLALVLRLVTWRALSSRSRGAFALGELRKVWKFSAGMSGVAITGILLLQLDKVVLSKLLNLSDFGHYALATVTASALYLLLTPTFNVAYPRLSTLVAQGDTSAIVAFYRKGTQLLCTALFPLACGVIVFAPDLLQVWTHNVDVASRAAPIVSIFLVGTALNGAMHFPYALQLAYGRTGLPLVINGVLLAVFVPLLLALTLHFGAYGGAASWAILNAFYLFFGAWLTHRELLPGLALPWLGRDVLLPLAVSVVFVGGGGFLLRPHLDGPWLNLGLCALLIGLGFVCLLILNPSARAALTDLTGRRPGISSLPTLGRSQ